MACHNSKQFPGREALKRIAAWILLLFVLTFVGALPLIAGGLSIDQLPPSARAASLVFAGIVLAAYAPTLAALLVAANTGGGYALLRQARKWRVGIVWYLLVLVGPFILILLADLLNVVLGGAPPKQWLVFPSGFAFIGPLLAGSLGEEPGWRGFAQPQLQTRYGALWASILIGVVWSTWHLWPAITPGGLSHLTALDVAQTYIRLISTAIIYAWLYNSTNGSLFLVMVAHAGHNLAINLIRIPEQGRDTVSLLIALLYMAAAIGVVMAAGSRTLSRQKGGIR
jgi:uncharacterized protein